MSLEEKLMSAEMLEAARVEEQINRMLLRHSTRPISVTVGPEWMLMDRWGNPRQRYRRQWGARWFES